MMQASNTPVALGQLETLEKIDSLPLSLLEIATETEALTDMVRVRRDHDATVQTLMEARAYLADPEIKVALARKTKARREAEAAEEAARQIRPIVLCGICEDIRCPLSRQI